MYFTVSRALSFLLYVVLNLEANLLIKDGGGRVAYQRVNCISYENPNVRTVSAQDVKDVLTQSEGVTQVLFADGSYHWGPPSVNIRGAFPHELLLLAASTITDVYSHMIPDHLFEEKSIQDVEHAVHVARAMEVSQDSSESPPDHYESVAPLL
jgi:hypothetical protein